MLLNPDARVIKFVNSPRKIFMFQEKIDEVAFENFVLQTIEREGKHFFAYTEVVSDARSVYSPRVLQLLRENFAMPQIPLRVHFTPVPQPSRFDTIINPESASILGEQKVKSIVLSGTPDYDLIEKFLRSLSKSRVAFSTITNHNLIAPPFALIDSLATLGFSIDTLPPVSIAFGSREKTVENAIPADNENFSTYKELPTSIQDVSIASDANPALVETFLVWVENYVSASERKNIPMHVHASAPLAPNTKQLLRNMFPSIKEGLKFYVQFSTLSPFTCLNSFSLLVTRVNPLLIASEAINKS